MKNLSLVFIAAFLATSVGQAKSDTQELSSSTPSKSLAEEYKGPSQSALDIWGSFATANPDYEGLVGSYARNPQIQSALRKTWNHHSRYGQPPPDYK